MTDLTLRREGRRLALGVEGPADAPPVLFLHGLTMSRDTWQETVAALVPRYRCWTLDLRGHGHSDPADTYGFGDYMADVRAVLELVGAPPFVVGHSLGGALGGALAQQPGVLRGALLEDPPWFLGDPDEARRAGFDRRFEVTRLLVERLRRDDAPLADYEAFLTHLPAAGAIARDHVSARHLLSRASALQRLDLATLQPVSRSLHGLQPLLPFATPVTFLQAAEAPAFLPGHGARLDAGGAAVTVLSPPGAGHIMHAERATEAWFIDTVRTAVAASS